MYAGDNVEVHVEGAGGVRRPLSWMASNNSSNSNSNNSSNNNNKSNKHNNLCVDGASTMRRSATIRRERNRVHAKRT